MGSVLFFLAICELVVKQDLLISSPMEYVLFT